MQINKHEQALMSQVANFEKKLRDKRAELLEYRIFQTGIKIGQIVFSKKRQYRVTRIAPTGWGRPWLYGNPTKKDGSFGVAEHRIYDDWTLEADENHAVKK